MTSYGSDLISDFFAANSCDLTPASARHVAQLLYVPVSNDPEITNRCASVLSDAEIQRADRFALPRDSALFKQRRAFRRFCGALALGSSQLSSQIEFEETKNGRPHLSRLPNVWFSFSSCPVGFLGAWSSTHAIGVDLEDQTRDLEAVELARKFFSAAEAQAVESAGGLASLRAFTRLWCLKEAALKSIGEGLPFGLDTFSFELNPHLRVVSAPYDYGGKFQFDAHIVEDSDSCAALIIRSLD